jgi:phosphate/phosphite/phosphonate ABC transporter binding protein
MRYGNVALTTTAVLLTLAPENALADSSAGQIPKRQTCTLRVGAVAYGPSSVTIWRGIRYYFAQQGMPLDYVLYSNYDALVEALHNGHVDIAWNSPLAHARYHLLCGGKSQTLVMRDVDRGYRSKLIVRKDAAISKLGDLEGKTIIFGSCDAAEATVLPIHYLKKEGVQFDKIKVLSLHEEIDRHGIPCCSEQHVLKALQNGRGQAGIISELLWKDLSARQPSEVAAFKPIWTSPSFSHCVFTASKDFDKKVGERFAKLMISMDTKDPLTADILELEGAKKWVEGTQEGYEDLLQALQDAKAVSLGKK